MPNVSYWTLPLFSVICLGGDIRLLSRDDASMLCEIPVICGCIEYRSLLPRILCCLYITIRVSVDEDFCVCATSPVGYPMRFYSFNHFLLFVSSSQIFSCVTFILYLICLHLDKLYVHFKLSFFVSQMTTGCVMD